MSEGPPTSYESITRRGEGTSVRVVMKTVLACMALLGLLWTLYTLRTVLLLLLLSLLLSYLLEPLVHYLSRGRLQWGSINWPLPRLPRLVSIGLVYLLGLTIVISLMMLVLPIALKEGRSLIESVPAYVTFIQGKTAYLAALYHRYNLPTAWQPFVETSLTKGVHGLLSLLQQVVRELPKALAYAWWLIFPPLLAFFLLKDNGRLYHPLLACLPQAEQRRRLAALLHEIEVVLAVFIRTQLALCVFMGLCIIGLLTSLGIPYGFLLGLLAAILEFIPVFGPLVAGALIFLVAVVRDPFLALWVLLALTVLRLIQDYVVVPRVMGQHIHLHPAVIIIAVLCGAELAGVAGVFLATPVAAIIKVLLIHWQRYRRLPEHAADSFAPAVPHAPPAPATTSEVMPPGDHGHGRAGLGLDDTRKT